MRRPISGPSDDCVLTAAEPPVKYAHLGALCGGAQSGERFTVRHSHGKSREFSHAVQYPKPR